MFGEIGPPGEFFIDGPDTGLAGQTGLFQLFLQEGAEVLGYPFGGLEDAVAGEAVGDHDVKVGTENVVSFDVPGEIDVRSAPEFLVGLPAEFGSLALLGADVEQADPGGPGAEDRLVEKVAHDRV
ncbi:MAG: hypothetical protein BWY73_01651 [candidate division TA06 bacterium ADurb.Bin417]|uniref:Uncharacterized protein n=1 Tax=candidate division TA06 bacterium ADurb.Bin417 TaxID=1852828 RepID=A0A1V5M5P2_UNCT6|nr:MAG: hypothetical protein BWY73_01651 [candidate division TA06 bacterium ADurb.Bin417]